jgi:hypothetical protein
VLLQLACSVRQGVSTLHVHSNLHLLSSCTLLPWDALPRLHDLLSGCPLTVVTLVLPDPLGQYKPLACHRPRASFNPSGRNLASETSSPLCCPSSLSPVIFSTTGPCRECAVTIPVLHLLRCRVCRGGRSPALAASCLVQGRCPDTVLLNPWAARDRHTCTCTHRSITHCHINTPAHSPVLSFTHTHPHALIVTSPHTITMLAHTHVTATRTQVTLTHTLTSMCVHLRSPTLTLRVLTHLHTQQHIQARAHSHTSPTPTNTVTLTPTHVGNPPSHINTLTHSLADRPAARQFLSPPCSLHLTHVFADGWSKKTLDQKTSGPCNS